MQPLTCLRKGLGIIDPFLKRHGFEFDNFEDGKDSGGEFTVGTYKKEQKKFVIDYRFSIGQVLYRFEHSVVSHPFYLDQLGFAGSRRHNGFLSDDKPEAFHHILFDFEFLLEDFFIGKCTKLQNFSKLHDNIIFELDKKIRGDKSIQFDMIKIEKARQEFRNKSFGKCIEIYSLILNKNLINDLDNKIIEFCSRNI